jgi:endogenous inhibitor of DNA gyrase (YacG/DUF329 family)
MGDIEKRVVESIPCSTCEVCGEEVPEYRDDPYCSDQCENEDVDW